MVMVGVEMGAGPTVMVVREAVEMAAAGSEAVGRVEVMVVGGLVVEDLVAEMVAVVREVVARVAVAMEEEGLGAVERAVGRVAAALGVGLVVETGEAAMAVGETVAVVGAADWAEGREEVELVVVGWEVVAKVGARVAVG